MMNRTFRGGIVALFLCGALSILRAEDQVNALIPPPDVAKESGHKMLDTMFPYLSVEQREEFEHALYPALEKNPQLETDGLTLLQAGGKRSGDVSPADFEAYKKQVAAYEARLREAMLAEDPAIGPIFDQIDAHVKAQSAP